MRTVEEYLAMVLAEVRPLDAVTVPPAAGAVLREPARARLDIPRFDNSAMDGFAVRFADVAHASPAGPVTLDVVKDIPAGSSERVVIEPGQAARIMTGAPVPTSADAIVPFEDTAGGLADSLEVVAVRTAKAGAFIRRRGQDVQIGDEVLAQGTLLGPLQLAALAAAGVDEVTVSARPRVAIISTGAELSAAGEVPGEGQIPDSNAVLLAELVADLGADVVGVARVTDDERLFRDVLARFAGTADVIICSGGVSAGAFEVVRNTLAGQIAFEQVAMQPGKPQAFGRLSDGELFFGLPGNPVSVAVSFEVLVRPALLAMQGAARIHRPLLRLIAAAPWTTPFGRRQYLPAVIDASDPARWTVRPATTGGSASHLAGGLGRAEAYAVVPADVDAVAVGDAVDVMLIG